MLKLNDKGFIGYLAQHELEGYLKKLEISKRRNKVIARTLIYGSLAAILLPFVSSTNASFSRRQYAQIPKAPAPIETVLDIQIPEQEPTSVKETPPKIEEIVNQFTPPEEAEDIPAAPKGYGYAKTLDVVATAYTPGKRCCRRSADGRTSTNYKIKRHDYIVAVDPKVIPIGSKVLVPGYGLARAIDVGSDIQGNRIDVLMTVTKNKKTPLKRALEWGQKNLEVIIYKKL